MAGLYEWKVRVQIEPVTGCGDDQVVQSPFDHTFFVADERFLARTDILIQVLDQMEVE